MKTKIKRELNFIAVNKSVETSNKEPLTSLLRAWSEKLGYYSLFAALPAILGTPAAEIRAAGVIEPPGLTAEPAGRVNQNRSDSEAALTRRQSRFGLPHQIGKFDLVSAYMGGDDCPGTAIPPVPEIVPENVVVPLSESVPAFTVVPPV